MYKDILREKYKKIRKNINKEESINIINKLFECDLYKKSDALFIYVSINDEVDTHFLIKEALKEKTVLVPYCISGTNDMYPVKIESFDDLKVGSFNILEPKKVTEYKGKIDLSIVPGIVFSKSGHRLGYGKGFYDKFLKEHSCVKIGLSYDELVVNDLPYNDLDVKMDMIFTGRKEYIIK